MIASCELCALCLNYRHALSLVREINNGRIAMFAIMGQIVAELQTGKGPVEQFMG